MVVVAVVVVAVLVLVLLVVVLQQCIGIIYVHSSQYYLVRTTHGIYYYRCSILVVQYSYS